MGVAYKLTPEIKKFILSAKKIQPQLSCRSVRELVRDKFRIALSKSSVNAVFKQTRLSLSVGRRRISKSSEIPAGGEIILKAVDSLFAGSVSFLEGLRGYFKGRRRSIFRRQIETLIYAPFVTQGKPLLVLKEPERSRMLLSDLRRIIGAVSLPARYIRFDLSGGGVFYLDSRFYTVWPSSRIPAAFSDTVHNVKKRLSEWIAGSKPIILFFASGYDAPTDKFMDFVLSLESGEKPAVNAAICGSGPKEIEKIDFPCPGPRQFIFAVWPWQFTGSSKINLTSGFSPLYHRASRKTFHIAEAEFELRQKERGIAAGFRGCAVKDRHGDKIRMFILTGIKKMPLKNIALAYLDRWPNLEETFKDFSRKVELSGSCSGGSIPHQEPSGSDAADALLGDYLRILDDYVRQFLFPPGQEISDFSEMTERFYRLKVILKKRRKYMLAKFYPPKNYRSRDELRYLCRRLNERDIVLFDDKRLWFLPA